jgi:adenylate cyclase
MPKRILFVEDNAFNRDALARRLGNHGFEVAVATDGEEGIRIAQTVSPDLILMDLSLPRLDGPEAVRKIKRAPATKDIPVIALVSHATTGDGESALEAGCDDFDTKPVVLARLLGKIKVLLNGTSPAAGGRDAGPAAAQGRERDGAAADPTRPTILVVDDNAENRDLLVRRLERESYAVRVAEGGRQGLASLDTGPVDLVLLDVMMPDLDGIQVLERMKADPRHQASPVLMISALDELDIVVRSIDLGAEDYLSKPFNSVLLRARIGACLEKKRLRDQEKRYREQIEEWNRTLGERVEQQIMELEGLGRLKRFFSPQLAERILAGGEDDPLRTHRREITVVFLDLRGFTAFAETSEPEEVMRVLREYHEQMGRLILAHEGTLERFTGDGLMVFFNDPIEVPNPSERAVRMAIAMRDSVDSLQQTWRKRGYHLALGIGIARGYATVGAIGFEGRWDYAAIGTVTNLAARLCSESGGGQILVSPHVAAAVEEFARLEPVGCLTLKGLTRTVDTYSVIGLKA